MTDLSTPKPVYHSGLPRTVSPDSMDIKEKITYRTAASRASLLYPGAIGELISRELLTADEFGWVLYTGCLVTRVRDQVTEQWRERYGDRP